MGIATKYVESLSEKDRQRWKAAVAELKQMQDQRILRIIIEELTKDDERMFTDNKKKGDLNAGRGKRRRSPGRH